MTEELDIDEVEKLFDCIKVEWVVDIEKQIKKDLNGAVDE